MTTTTNSGACITTGSSAAACSTTTTHSPTLERELKQRIEDTTDVLALAALDALDDDEVETLFRSLTPITRKVVAAGDVPAATPMGLSRDDLDDDSAHLT